MKRNLVLLAAIAMTALVGGGNASTADAQVAGTLSPASAPIYACKDVLLGTINWQTTHCDGVLSTSAVPAGVSEFKASFNADGTLSGLSNLVNATASNPQPGVYVVTFSASFPDVPSCAAFANGAGDFARASGVTQNQLTVEVTVIQADGSYQLGNDSFDISCGTPN